ncbi:DNA-binding protein [Sulfurovum sp. bin170]|uniref:DNA-binding protein n=1 Tax=Sulfurovum sp. bin170 TaxID=2695268 RepID=UPI0013E07D1B|nr:DNA-binding protein [Sulfurovum sp. bin170]NEW60494.1 DNA-binding protein [Sulfurovum sp. bin170]
MHTITLKSDSDFFIMLNEMVKSLNTTRSDLIRRAVVHYRDTLEREKLKIQIKKASMRTRDESLKVSKEFDTIIYDGLKDV